MMWTPSLHQGRPGYAAAGNGRRTLRRRVSEGLMFDMASFTNNDLPRDLPYVGGLQQLPSQSPLVTPSSKPGPGKTDCHDEGAHDGSNQVIVVKQHNEHVHQKVPNKTVEIDAQEKYDPDVVNLTHQFKDLTLRDRVQKQITQYFPLKTSLSAKSSLDGNTKKKKENVRPPLSLKQANKNKENINANHVNAKCVGRNLASQ